MAEESASTETARREGDLEKGDQAVASGNLDDGITSTIHSESPTDDSITENLKDQSLSRTQTGATDSAEDPFALFPALSITMSSTRAPFSRRNTATTLTRPLTREETRNTLKSVRSRFTEVRSEFDENVSIYLSSPGAEGTNGNRTIFRNLPQLMKIWSRLMDLKTL